MNTACEAKIFAWILVDLYSATVDFTATPKSENNERNLYHIDLDDRDSVNCVERFKDIVIFFFMQNIKNFFFVTCSSHS